MAAIPIRVRLTLPFAAAMAVVLTASGAFIYVRVGQQLLDTVDTNLRAQLVEVRANAGEQSALIDRDASLGPTVAAVELPTGEALAREPSTLARIPIRAPESGTAFFTSRIEGLRGRWRIAETRTRLAERPVVLVVGRSLDGRDETLDHLAHEFLFAAPAALLLAALRRLRSCRRSSSARRGDAPTRRGCQCARDGSAAAAAEGAGRASRARR